MGDREGIASDFAGDETLNLEPYKRTYILIPEDIETVRASRASSHVTKVVAEISLYSIVAPYDSQIRRSICVYQIVRVRRFFWMGHGSRIMRSIITN